MLALWNLGSKLLAPLAPIFLIFAIILGAASWHLYSAKEDYKEQVVRLNYIIEEQTEVISACRDDNEKLDNVLIKLDAEKQALQDKTVKSLSKLEKLACGVTKPKTDNGVKLDAIKDEDVLNMQLGDATIGLLNEATGTPSN